MALETFANFPATTVPAGASGTLSSGQADTWVVSSSAAFPVATTGVTKFHVADTSAAASSELILVTNTGGTPATTWSVIRGAESTTPVAHPAGFTITQVIAAGWLNGVSGGTLPAGNVTTAKEFLTSTGSGGTANTPVWGTIATSDVPVLNQNTSGTAAAVSGTVAVGNGGTGLSSLTTYNVVVGGTASTTPVQQVASAGTVSQVLTSNGAGALPSWQNATGGGSSVTFPITVPGGGTGGTAVTAYALVTGGTAAATPLQTVTGVGTSGQVLTSQGTGQLPQWANTGGTQVPAYAVVTGGTTSAAPFQAVSGVGATSGQVLTYQGSGSLPTWTTVSGGGGSSGGATVQNVTYGAVTGTLNTATYGAFFVTLSGAPTFAFTGASAGTETSFTLYLKQPASGTIFYTPTWPSGTASAVQWQDSIPPSLSAVNSAVDILVFASPDGGVNWYGSLAGVNYA